MGKINKNIAAFREAAKKVIDRAREMQLAAENSREALIKLFTRHEARVTSDVAIGFATTSLTLGQDKIENERELILKVREQVLLTNDLIASYTQSNPHLLTGFTNLENTFFNYLLDGDRTMLPNITLRGVAFITPIFRSPIFAAFEQIRIALTGGKASDGLGSRKDVIAFMRSLYDKKDPQLNSYPHIANFVRTCNDPHDPRFNEFVQIRVLVREWASKTADGEDKVWRSLAQEIKPSHRK